MRAGPAWARGGVVPGRWWRRGRRGGGRGVVCLLGCARGGRGGRGRRRGVVCLLGCARGGRGRAGGRLPARLRPWGPWRAWRKAGGRLPARLRPWGSVERPRTQMPAAHREDGEQGCRLPARFAWAPPTAWQGWAPPRPPWGPRPRIPHTPLLSARCWRSGICRPRRRTTHRLWPYRAAPWGIASDSKDSRPTRVAFKSKMDSYCLS